MPMDAKDRLPFWSQPCVWLVQEDVKRSLIFAIRAVE